MMMDREIKFRAWSKTRNKMLEPSEVTPVFWPSLRFCEYDETSNQVDLPLMQYTGLKDKNGVEICEGDILTDGKEFAACLWLQGNAEFILNCLDYIDDDYTDLGSGVDQSNGWCGLEVAGNIYETPELLEDK